jgi:dTDP-6-deoxy-L-talose 4-dehydrogenase (NAD+)
MLQQGYAVVATSTDERKCVTRDWFRQVDFVPFQLENFSPDVNYHDFFHQPDFLIHLAWEGLPNYKALFHFESNLLRQYGFLKNMVENGLKDICVTGTCLEYGLREGILREDMVTDPQNPYALAKDALRRFLQQLQGSCPFTLRWIRLFYMYGKGQNPTSIFSQLEAAIQDGTTVFNMSGGDQVRDYLPVETVARYIAAIATQQKVTGIINCCSGKPVSLKDLVTQYVKERNATVTLNLGYYPYTDYEPMRFWGDSTKLQTIIQHEKSN